MSGISDLENLAKLKENNLITDEEFEQQKKAILEKNLQQNNAEISGTKNGIIFVILAWFFGCLGVHNFYAGYVKKGIAQLLLTLFSWILFFIPLLVSSVWSLYDLFFITKDARGNKFTGSPTVIRVLKIIIFTLMILAFFGGLLLGTSAVMQSGSMYSVSVQ